MSTTLRRAYIKALGAVRKQNFVARSGLGYDFVCHIGDFLGENPFYNRKAFVRELTLCSAWLDNQMNPVVYDIGAHVGFFATHLAQMIARRAPVIYAFEPVPTTFVKLMQSVQGLGLQNNVYPIAAAVLDSSGPVRIGYSQRNSLFAQIAVQGLNPRIGDSIAYAASITIDEFYSQMDVPPALLKIDVEGSEPAVLRGARGLLSGPDRPAVIFEYNPLTLAEIGATAHSFHELLVGYELYYVDDFEGQKIPLGSQITRVEEVQWVCNLFAVPIAEAASAQWNAALKQTMRRLDERAG